MGQRYTCPRPPARRVFVGSRSVAEYDFHEHRFENPSGQGPSHESGHDHGNDPGRDNDGAHAFDGLLDQDLDAADDSPDSTFVPPLPPADRIWRHPSELAFEEQLRQRRSSWSIAAGAALSGAVAVGAVWLAVGSATGVRLATERVSLAPVESVQPLVVPADEWPAVVTAFAREGTAVVMADGGETPVAAAVAYRDDGYLITSARAIAGYDSLVVVTPDGSVYEAEVVGVDLATDVSVLSIGSAITPVVIAEAAHFASGERIAIVDPEGDARESQVDSEAGSTETSSGDLLLGTFVLDTKLGDTPPGSPIVDETGAVTGITTATEPAADAAVIPIEVAREVAAQLVEDGWAEHAWLGITARDVMADEIETGSIKGAFVIGIDEDGPASIGGVEERDVIVALDGEAIGSLAMMVAALRNHRPGDKIVVDVQRWFAVDPSSKGSANGSDEEIAGADAGSSPSSELSQGGFEILSWIVELGTLDGSES